MKTKTINTPLMMAVAFGPRSCPFRFVPKSELLHNQEALYGFVPKHSLHSGKNIALLAEKPIYFNDNEHDNLFKVLRRAKRQSRLHGRAKRQSRA
jgi:hypothetical protein